MSPHAPLVLDASSVRLTSHEVWIGGSPRIVASGELHYARVPRQRWAQALADLKAIGMDAVASYIFWNHHQPRREEPADFSDALDLGEFCRMAREAGLMVVLRIGPWCHGEARHGGLPDWVASGPWRVRSNDPAYLEQVRKWYRTLLHEVVGELDNVIAIQVENELHASAEHLTRLKQIAQEVGFRAPLWFATAWGGAELDAGQFTPVFGGYADAFWDQPSHGWVEDCALSFSVLPQRDDPSIGRDLRSATDTNHEAPAHGDAPWLTAELGGGMAIAYHRRPVVEPDSITAMAVAKVASGTVWLGYYMIHGGISPELGAGPLMESHGTGYANDLPLRDYDFQAPFGPGGDWRPHAHGLRLLHSGLRAMGEGAASSLPRIEPPGQASPDDVEHLRCGIRTTDGRGLVAFNNLQPYTAMPTHDGVQVDVEGVLVPPVPVRIEPGDHGFWPVRLRLSDDLELLSANVQPVGSVDLADGVLWLFQQVLEGQAELLLEGDRLVSVPIEEPETVVDLGGGVRAMLVRREVAADYWLVDGQLLRGSGMVTTTPGGDLVWRSGESGDLARWQDDGWVAIASAAVAPPADLPTTLTAPGRRPAQEHGRLTASVTPSGDTIPQQGRASAPAAEAFADAAVHRVELPPDLGDDDVVELRWQGDVLRVTRGDAAATEDAAVVVDQFWHGDRPCQVPALLLRGEDHLTVSVLGLPEDAELLAVGQQPDAGLLAARLRRVASTVVR